MADYRNIKINGFFWSYKQLGDLDVEKKLGELRAIALSDSDLIVNLTSVAWVDLYAILSLLFVIRLKSEDQMGSKGISILRITDPKNMDSEQSRRYKKVLSLLAHLDFFNKAAEAGCVFQWVTEHTKHFFNCRDISLSDLESSIRTQLQDVKFDSPQVIPIQTINKSEPDAVESLISNLRYDIDFYLDQYMDVPLVEEGGLADTTIVELIKNIVYHGGEWGYIALRAVGVSGKKTPLKHILPDKKRIQDLRCAYFELIIADNGRGISDSIKNATHIPLVKQICADEKPNKEQRLIRCALKEQNSRLTIAERNEKGLSPVTGYGAIRRLMLDADGFLLIRQKNERYIYAPCAGRNEWRGASYTHFYDEGNKENIAFHDSGILSVSCIFPFSSKVDPNLLYKRKFQPKLKYSLSDNLLGTPVVFVDDKLPESANSWKSINQGFDVSRIGPVIFDVRDALSTKDALWKGLSDILSMSAGRHPIFLTGLNARLAGKIQRLFNSSARKDCSEVIFGICDSNEAYVFCSQQYDIKSRVSLLEKYFVAGDPPERSLIEPENPLSKFFSHDYTAEGIYKSSMVLITAADLKYIVLRELGKKLSRYIEEKKQIISYADGQVMLPTGGIVDGYVDTFSLLCHAEFKNYSKRYVSHAISLNEFDYIISVGSLARECLPDCRQQKKSYLNYANFDHGEAPWIKQKGVRIALVIDGFKSGQRLREAVAHVKDSGGELACICSLFNFSKDVDALSRSIGTEIHAAVNLPFEDILGEQDIAFVINPFYHCLQRADDGCKLLLHNNIDVDDRGAPISIFENESAVYSGHCAYGNQHHRSSFLLWKTFSSHSRAFVSILRYLEDSIDQRKIDLILYPEESSVQVLINELQRRRNINAVMCKKGVFPGGRKAYDLTLSGKKRLKASRNILIVEDQSFSGTSLKSIILEVIAQDFRYLKSITASSIIDSMNPSDKEHLFAILEFGRSRFNGKVAFSFSNYIRFGLSDSWSGTSCPYCSMIEHYKQIGNENAPDFLIHRTALDRIAKLRPFPLDAPPTDSVVLEPISHDFQFLYTSKSGENVRTVEGMALALENDYSNGHISHLVDCLFPSSVNYFDPHQSVNKSTKVVLKAIEVLSTDLALLDRLRLRKKFTASIIKNITRGFLDEDYCLLLETLSRWPLHWIREIWEPLINQIIKSPIIISRNAASIRLLLGRIERSSAKVVRDSLLNDFINKIYELVETTSDPLDDKGILHARQHKQFALSLVRNLSKEEFVSPSVYLGELFTILAYHANDNHQALRKTLDILSSEDSPGKQVLTLPFCVQMISYVLHCVVTLSKSSASYFKDAGEERKTGDAAEGSNLLAESHSAKTRDKELNKDIEQFRECSVKFLTLSSELFDTNDQIERVNLLIAETAAGLDRQVGALKEERSRLIQQQENLGEDLKSQAHHLRTILYTTRKEKNYSEFGVRIQDLLNTHTATSSELKNALSDHINDAKERFGKIDCQFSFNSDLGEGSRIVLDKSGLYIIIEELVENILRHSNSKKNLSRSSYGELFEQQEIPTVIHLDVNIYSDLSQCRIEVLSKCSIDNYHKMKSGLGYGMIQIASTLEGQGGELMEPQYDEVRNEVKQCIRLRRVI